MSNFKKVFEILKEENFKTEKNITIAQANKIMSSRGAKGQMEDDEEIRYVKSKNDDIVIGIYDKKNKTLKYAFKNPENELGSNATHMRF